MLHNSLCIYLEGSDGGNGWGGDIDPSNLKDKVRKILFSIRFFSTHGLFFSTHKVYKSYRCHRRHRHHRQTPEPEVEQLRVA